MKLSVFTVCTPELAPSELLLCLKELGYDGVEWRFREVPAEAANETPSYWRNNLCSIDPASTSEEIRRLRDATLEAGLHPIALNPYLEHMDLSATEHAFRVAALLGAKKMRIGVPKYNGSTNYRDLFTLARDYLYEVQNLSEQYGVQGLVETHHHTIAPSASSAFRLVEGFNPAHIGVLYDPGNMPFEGFENHLMGLQLLGPYLAHVHMKNSYRQRDGEEADGRARWKFVWSALPDGMIDWKQVLGDLKHVEYDGYVGVEDFSGAMPARQMLRANKAWFDKWRLD